MKDDYKDYGKRKSKTDTKAKRAYRVYKTGGKFRLGKIGKTRNSQKIS